MPFGPNPKATQCSHAVIGASPCSDISCSADPPPSVRLVRPQVEATLEGVIGKALAKRRHERFATIGDLADALRRACPQVDGCTRLLDVAAPVAPRRKFNRAPYRTPISIKSSWGEVTGRSEDISEGASHDKLSLGAAG